MTIQNDNEPAVYTVAKLAERWGTSTRSIYDLIRAGKLKTFRIGKREFRITADEVKRHEEGRAA